MEKFYGNISIPILIQEATKARVSTFGVEAGTPNAHGMQEHWMLSVSPRGDNTNKWHHCWMHTQHHSCKDTASCCVSAGI
eukprot:11280802-Karenia_brevis.AAC.1